MKNYRKRVQKVNGKDCLTNLHEDILIHILSLLDVKSAAQTCVLSRRWNNKLWIHHPDVYLNSKTFGKTSYKFREFVDTVLTQRHKLQHKIRSFSFTWTFKSRIPQELLDKVHAQVQYHGVRHFDLSIICCASRRSHYPSQKFNPKSLTTLRLNLSNRYRGSLCTDLNLKLLHLYLSGCTTLKTLWLEKISMKINSVDVDLFSSLVDLTELYIIGCYIIGEDGRFLVRAPRLERLTILENSYDLPCLEISSDVLKYLRTDQYLSRPTINYIDKLEIDFPSFGDYKIARLANAIKYLPHAKTVTLSKSILQAISYFPRIFIYGEPPLPRLKWEHLKVITRNELPTTEFPEYLPGLTLLKSRCLKTLKVEYV